MEFTAGPIKFVAAKNRQTFKPLHPHSTEAYLSPLFSEIHAKGLATPLSTSSPPKSGSVSIGLCVVFMEMNNTE
jgi:hypothetical protein